MIVLPNYLNLKKDLWDQASSFINVFLDRRNLTFQHQLNDEIFLYQHNETGNPTFLVLVYLEKMGIEHLKSYIQYC